MIEFKADKRNNRFIDVKDAIQQAIDKSKTVDDTYSFDCNGCLLIVDSKSDLNVLLDQYWQYKHDQGIADGTIQELTIDF